MPASWLHELIFFFFIFQSAPRNLGNLIGQIRLPKYIIWLSRTSYRVQPVKATSNQIIFMCVVLVVGLICMLCFGLFVHGSGTALMICCLN